MELQRTLYTYSPIGRGTSRSQPGRAWLGSIVKYGRGTLWQRQCRRRPQKTEGPRRRSQGGTTLGGSEESGWQRGWEQPEGRRQWLFAWAGEAYRRQSPSQRRREDVCQVLYVGTKETEWLCREASPRRVGVQFRGFAPVRAVRLTHGTQPTLVADVYSRQQLSQVEGFTPMPRYESHRALWTRQNSGPYEGNYYWPNMEKWVRNYIWTFGTCQRNQTARHYKYGKLVQLEIPPRPWEQISIDFIPDPLNFKGYNQCYVIVDRFTKMAHFIPLKNRKAKQLAMIFVREVWRLQRLPKRVVSDRDTVFMSSFCSAVMRLLAVELDKSSAYHPQTDAQTEQVNRILEPYLRLYCMWDQNDWVDLLPFAEFGYNNTVHTVTKQTLFFAA